MVVTMTTPSEILLVYIRSKYNYLFQHLNKGEWIGDRREGFGSLTFPVSHTSGEKRSRMLQYAGAAYKRLVQN